MSVLEFSEVVAAQLVNDDFSDMNPIEHDPDMARFEENESNENKNFPGSQEKITDYYCSFVVEHSTGHRSKHRLIKSELRENKRGKKYHKTNNCFVCRRSNIRKQTTFICSKCNVPLCYPMLTERNSAPTNCFRKYHERMQMHCIHLKESDSDHTDVTEIFDEKSETEKINDMI